MKKLLALLICLAGMCALLVACGGGETSEGPSGAEAGDGGAATEEPAEQVVIKISHQNATTHPTQLGLERFKELLEEKSGGTMTCDIYDNAVLGNDTSNLQQVIAGSLDAAMIMGADIWQGYDSRATIENLPFMFTTYEEARSAWDGEFGDYMKENVLNPVGGHVVDFWENGFRHFTNNTRPIVLPEDCAGIKFRTAENPIRLQMFETFGASAIVMNFSELYSAMQQGTVDGEENPLSNIVASCFYEVQDYLSLSGHIYSTSVFVFSDKCWDSLTDEQKQIVEECSEEAKQYTRELTESQDEDYLQVCIDNGMEVNEVDKDAFIEASQPVWDTFQEEYGTEMVDLAMQYVNS